MNKENIFLLFEIFNGHLYTGTYQDGVFNESEKITINTNLDESVETQKEIISIISRIMKNSVIPHYYTRLYWSVNHHVELKKLLMIRNYFFTSLGINLNNINNDLRKIYLNQSKLSTDTILYGICEREFRTAVLCGSFRKHLPLVKKVFKYCKVKGIEVTSPQNLNLESIYNDNFVLFHGEQISNERETYWIEHQHTEAMRNADVVIICNSAGYVGTTTIYEIGFAQSLNKRIVFLDECCGDFDISFPKDYGLLGF